MSDAAFSVWHRPRLPSRIFVPLRPGRVATLVGLAALAVVLLTFALFSLLRLHETHLGTSAVSAPPRPEWLDVPRPVHLYDLSAPTLQDLPLGYSARRRAAGDGREDVLAYGAPGHDAPALRLRLFRRAVSDVSNPPLFAAIARQAAESGLSIARSGRVDLMPTKFGKFEIADVTLTDAASARLPCSGFRLALDVPALTIGGLACGTPDRPVTRSALGCLLDRLDLASGGEDRDLIDFFAASERRVDPTCAGARLAPDAIHAAWLDDKPATRTKTLRRRQGILTASPRR